MSDTISIRGLDHADVLAVLYNASRPQGMGFLQFNPKDMTKDEAASLLEKNAVKPPDKRGVYFDYLKGRVMKVRIGGDTLDPRLYDRDNGDGAAERAINSLRKTEAQ
jgi:hypothetical protein